MTLQESRGFPLGLLLLTQSAEGLDAGCAALEAQLAAWEAPLMLGQRGERRRRLAIAQRLLRLFQEPRLLGERR